MLVMNATDLCGVHVMWIFLVLDTTGECRVHVCRGCGGGVV